MESQTSSLASSATSSPSSPLPSGVLTTGFLQAAQALAQRVEQREEELMRLLRVTERINYGVVLEEILEFVYHEMKPVIPFERIGFSLIDEERGMVRAHWAKSDRTMLLGKGFEAPLKGSTLEAVIQTHRPRIINDLEDYLHKKPASGPTQLIVREGLRSNLTCPLIVHGKAVGFMFFASSKPNTYSSVHVQFFQQIAGQLSAILEKGRLYSELARQKQIIEQQNGQMRHELEMARQVQRMLVPESTSGVEGMEVAMVYEPAIEVGGDVLDVVRLEDKSLLCFVGDAMGHGVQAALVMCIVKTAFQAAARADPRPVSVLSSINRQLARMFDDRFVTAVCCRVAPGAAAMEVALAGHPPPVHHRAGRAPVEVTAPTAMPLGMDTNEQYQSATLNLGRGDVVVLFTDGIIEAMPDDHSLYGIERLMGQVNRHADASADQLAKAIRADLYGHLAGKPMVDDLTLMVLKR